MALAVTEEHQALADSVRGWAERNAGPEVVRAAVGASEHRAAGACAGPAAGGAAEDGASGYEPQALLAGLADQGLLGLHLADSQGGQGFGLAELTVAVAELGRSLLPGGYLPTVLASAALAAAGADSKLVAGLADGTRSGALGLAGGITATPAAKREGETGGGLVLRGGCSPVLGGSLADLIVLPVSDGASEIWVAVDAAELEITALDSLDLTRPVAQVRADEIMVPAERVLAGLSRAAVSGIAATLLGAEAAGIAAWAVATAADYAKIRQQFGRPIGQFQAVKHRCARMLTQAEQADATVWDAARALDLASGAAASPDAAAAVQADFAASVAAAVAIDAAVECAHECIQVLGGIGYTWEHDAHLYYRRALSLRALLGPSGGWVNHVAELATSGIRRELDVELPDETAGQRARIRAELAEISGLSFVEQIEQFAAGGWVAPHLPRPWGRAAGPLEQVVIAQELRAAGLRPQVLFIGAWATAALVRYGTSEQQQRFLPRTLRNQLIWCQLFSEPGAGSDLAGIRTRAERVMKGDGEAGGGWRLTGQKIWTSVAKHANWAICIARTDPAEPRHDGISYFLVDMSAPGVEVRPLREMTGDALFNEVFLDGVFVPDDCVVGEVNGGWKVARTTLANERVSLSQSWTSGFGVAELLDYAAKRDAAALGLLEQVGHLVCGGHALDVLGLRVTLRQISGTEPGATASVRKLISMRHAQQVTECCWTLSGTDGTLGAAVSRGGDQDDPQAQARHWVRQVLMTRALTIGGGTTDIQLNIIAERMLGLPRDPEPPGA